MTIYTHPNASKVIISMRLETPNRGIPYNILVVEANIPLSEENEGYDASSWEAYSILCGKPSKKCMRKRQKLFIRLATDTLKLREYQ
jgi:hypothetical protein